MPNSSTEIEVYGTTLLTAAFCSGLLGNDAVGPLHEAEAVAGQISGSGTNAFWFNFNRANVNQWRMNIALEADDPVRAVEIAQQIDIDDIPARSRKSGFLIDQARALYALRGKDDDVIELLRRAEKLGPTRTRNNIWVREMVSEMWHRSRRDAGGRELRGLADRMGIISAA